MPLVCNCPLSAEGPSLSASPMCPAGPLYVFMGLLEQFMRTQCDVQDPCGRFPPVAPAAEYDFIVVGGGSGSVVASRLSEEPTWKVLLVEAGGNEPTGSQVPSMFINYFNSDIDWGYKTEPEEMACLGKDEKRCSWPRGKVIGGTSVIHGMMYMRGSKTDYNNWASKGNTGWSYSDVLPYFKKSEDNLQLDRMDKEYHGRGGYMPVGQFPYHPPMAYSILEGARELGHRVGDLNGATHTGFAIAQSTSKHGTRYSTARAFLRPVKHRANLHVLLNTTVTRVLVDPVKKEVTGVEVITRDGRTKRILARKEVVISGGAVNSPQILLLSGIGPKEDLNKIGIPVAHDLPGVGKNLHNHVAYQLKFSVNETAFNPLSWATAMQYMMFRDGLMSGTGLSATTGFINSKFANANEDHPDIQIFFGGYLAYCSKTGDVKETTNNGKRQVTMTPTVLHPKSTGHLTLKDKNPQSHPRIFGKYLTVKSDIETLIEAIQFCIKLSNTNALQKYGMELDKTPVTGCDSFEFGSDSYWECAIRTNTNPEHHQAGSCKMGPASDPEAVVNPELKVNGIKRLRVMDASVMPRVTSGNTNAPCIMIAEKGSDMIKKDWQKRYASYTS